MDICCVPSIVQRWKPLIPKGLLEFLFNLKKKTNQQLDCGAVLSFPSELFSIAFMNLWNYITISYFFYSIVFYLNKL